VRTQHLANNLAGAPQTNFLIPRTTSVGGGVDLSYAHSPRTQLGISAASNRISSALVDLYSTTATASIGRKMGVHWFLQASGGIGKMTPIRNTFGLDTSPKPVASGSLGYRTLSHTILGSYSHTVSDSYGLGAATTSSAGGSWRWSRPGRSWWIESSAGWQQLAGAAYANSSGWRIEGGYGRILSEHLTLLTQCVYLNYSQQIASIPSLSQTAVRVTVTWNKDPYGVR
jgi:hypothetical protein